MSDGGGYDDDAMLHVEMHCVSKSSHPACSLPKLMALFVACLWHIAAAKKKAAAAAAELQAGEAIRADKMMGIMSDILGDFGSQSLGGEGG